MFNWALTFLIVAIIAGVFAITGVAGSAVKVAWTVFVISLILAVLFALTGRRLQL